jgi:hypothetical protein
MHGHSAGDISSPTIVVGFYEAINWIAYGNFAEAAWGPQMLHSFFDGGASSDIFATEALAKEDLAADLLLDRVARGDVRFFGRKAILETGDDYDVWSKPAKEPEIVPREVLASGSWTDDDGGGVCAEDVSYWGVAVHYDDLMRWFPDRNGTQQPTASIVDRKSDGAAEQRIRSSAKAERACARWIAELVEKGDRPPNRRLLRQEALEKFTGVSKRGFDRCWDRTAPDEWKAAGRRRMTSLMQFDAN